MLSLQCYCNTLVLNLEIVFLYDFVYVKGVKLGKGSQDMKWNAKCGLNSTPNSSFFEHHKNLHIIMCPKLKIIFLGF